MGYRFCDCVSNYIKRKPKECEECLRISGMIVKSVDAPQADGGTIEVDLDELVETVPDSCGDVSFSVHSRDESVFTSATIDGQNVLTITTTGSTTFTAGKLYKVVIEADCSDNYLGTYFDIETPIV